ncbi:uncharacterized protein LOC143041625 [Oratosquilla oratoria]|uniref:uncharacterized protein LOC143041625 n=1 Tax=Oratosquilla oratoria TaxID=337810 RepID=UPI003F76CB7F
MSANNNNKTKVQFLKQFQYTITVIHYYYAETLLHSIPQLHHFVMIHHDQGVREELEDKLAEITITGETIEQQWKIDQSQVNNTAKEVVGVKWTGVYKKKRTAYWNEEVQEAVKGNGEHNYSIKDSQGNLLTEPEEIDKRWKEYFSSLLNIEEDGERTDEEQSNGVWVDEEGINESEVKKALAKIKNNKACGIDNIPGEIFKYSGGIALSLLTELLSKAWDTDEVPNDWSTGLICPVFKKGDHAECSNYRCISLLSHAGKIYERMLKAHLSDRVERKLVEA